MLHGGGRAARLADVLQAIHGSGLPLRVVKRLERAAVEFSLQSQPALESALQYIDGLHIEHLVSVLAAVAALLARAAGLAWRRPSEC